jgi:hypothetical protein
LPVDALRLVAALVVGPHPRPETEDEDQADSFERAGDAERDDIVWRPLVEEDLQESVRHRPPNSV